MRPSPAAPGAGVTAGASAASLSFPALQALLSASVCAALCTYPPAASGSPRLPRGPHAPPSGHPTANPAPFRSLLCSLTCLHRESHVTLFSISSCRTHTQFTLLATFKCAVW